MTLDEVHVPQTRGQLGLPPLDPTKEDILGSTISDDVVEELWNAVGDSPISTTLTSAAYLVRVRSRPVVVCTSTDRGPSI
jgi:omega-6 fatty acid desaturase (delta-12 desaturase)